MGEQRVAAQQTRRHRRCSVTSTSTIPCPATSAALAGAISGDLIIVDVVANALAAVDLDEDRAKDFLVWATDTASVGPRRRLCAHQRPRDQIRR